MPIVLEEGKDQYTKAEVAELARKSDEEATEKLEVLEIVSEMSDAEKGYYKSLEGAAKDEFLYMESAERASLVQKSVDADPVVYTTEAGNEIRKSDGSLALELAKGRDEDRKEMKKLKGEAEDASLTKRAEGEFVNLPGTVETRKAILKSVDAIEDKAEREAALDALKAKSVEMAGSLTTVGSSTVPAALEKGGAEAELDELTKAYRRENPTVNAVDAYTTVATANPELYSRAVNGQ